MRRLFVAALSLRQAHAKMRLLRAMRRAPLREMPEALIRRQRPDMMLAAMLDLFLRRCADFHALLRHAAPRDLIAVAF